MRTAIAATTVRIAIAYHWSWFARVPKHRRTAVLNCLDDSTGGRAQAILDDVILHAEAMIRREMIRQRSDLLAGDDEYVTFSVSIDLGRQEIQWQSEEQHAALDGDDVAAAIEDTLWQLQVFVD